LVLLAGIGGVLALLYIAYVVTADEPKPWRRRVAEMGAVLIVLAVCALLGLEGP
jgi:peptidoglycan/LPS O-acetylase OafA/YrhL